MTVLPFSNIGFLCNDYLPLEPDGDDIAVGNREVHRIQSMYSMQFPNVLCQYYSIMILLEGMI